MPPKTKAPASEVEKYHLQIPFHLQLVYSMILETGIPSGNDAWTRVISRLPLTEKDGQPVPMSVRACWGRWMKLKDRLDKEMLFGENHEELLEEAVTLKEGEGGEKETRGRPKSSKGKGKEKEVEHEEEGDSAGEGLAGCQSMDEQEGAEASEEEKPAAKKARVTKAKKQTKKRAPVKAKEEKEEEEAEAELDPESEDEV